MIKEQHKYHSHTIFRIYCKIKSWMSDFSFHTLFVIFETTHEHIALPHRHSRTSLWRRIWKERGSTWTQTCNSRKVSSSDDCRRCPCYCYDNNLMLCRWSNRLWPGLLWV